MPSIYISKKSGEVKKYDNKKYNVSAYARNREKILSDHEYCDFCDCKYLKYNHSNHMKSKNLRKTYTKHKNTFNEIL